MNDQTGGENGLRIDSDQFSSTTTASQFSDAASPCLPLKANVSVALDRYFRDLGGESPTDLYSMVLKEVEQPLFAAVIAHTKGNKCRAAEILGINRNTLRKKLELYNLLG